MLGVFFVGVTGHSEACEEFTSSMKGSGATSEKEKEMKEETDMTA